jgi:uncharacterized membrane protein
MRKIVDLSPGQRALLGTLALSSAVGVSMYASRVLYTRSLAYAFLVWNIVLAWVPLLIAWALHATDASGARPSRARRLVLLSLWLLFFPNAPYIATDFLHVAPRPGVPMWFDVLLVMTFAWNGLMLGFCSLFLVHDVVRRRRGELAGWIVSIGALVLAAFGIYLGRFGRWNSWDLLARPHELLADIAGRLSHPLSHPRTLAVTLSYGTFLVLAYLTLCGFVAGVAASRVPLIITRNHP